MSHDTGVSRSYVGKHLPEEDDQEMSNESEDLIQDQVIIAPEIMNLILDNLDFRTLKQVRLVCKCWLREAAAHMERRGIVRFDRKTSTQRIWKFEQLRQNKMLSLRQPFHCVDLDLDLHTLNSVLELFSSDCPLAVARFSSVSVSMKLTFHILMKHSSTMEYLKLSRKPFEDEHVPRLPNGHEFPKLRHLVLDDEYGHYDILRCKSLPSFVAGIVKGSPNLETFECRFNAPEMEGREMLRAVDIKKVKTLYFQDHHLKQSAAEHFLTIPFSQLQNLTLALYCDGEEQTKTHIEAVKKCSATLRVLDLASVGEPEDLTEFPVCPNVQKLVLRTVPDLLSFLSQHFPSLRVLEVHNFCIDVEGELWRKQSALPALNTFRALNEYFQGQPDEFYFKFFEKFPGIEFLRLSIHSILRCCRLKASGDPRFSKILESLKNLEIQVIQPEYLKSCDCDDDDEATDVHFTSLAELRGVEVITLLDSNKGLMGIPVQDMPGLKVLRFPWGAHHSLVKLLDLAGRVPKVAVTNCCSFPRVGQNPWSTDVLNMFFHSAHNVECGCKG